MPRDFFDPTPDSSAQACVEEPAVADLEGFQLNIPARLILSDAQVEGVIIAFAVDAHGYRLMIESTAD